MIQDANISTERFILDDLQCEPPSGANWKVAPLRGWHLENLKALFDLDFEPIKFSPFECGRSGEWVGMKKEVRWETMVEGIRNGYRNSNDRSTGIGAESRASLISSLMEDSKSIGCLMCHLQEDKSGEIDRLGLKSQVNRLANPNMRKIVHKGGRRKIRRIMISFHPYYIFKVSKTEALIFYKYTPF